MLLAFAGLAIGSERRHRCYFRPNVFWGQRILLPLMVLATALANAWPVHTSLAEVGHWGFPGRSGAAAGWAARPGLGTFDWLAGLGLNAALGPKVTLAVQRGMAAAYGRLPLSFEANPGSFPSPWPGLRAVSDLKRGGGAGFQPRPVPGSVRKIGRRQPHAGSARHRGAARQELLFYRQRPGAVARPSG